MGSTIEKERTTTSLQDWGTLDDNASGAPYLETSQVDISSEIICTLHIAMCQDNTTAIGTSAFCYIWGKSGSADEDWRELMKFAYGTTACTEIDVSTGADSGDVSMACDTTNFSAVMLGSTVFVREKGTLANSFIATVIDYTTTLNELWLLDAAATDITDTAHADKIYCITVSPYSSVAQWNVEIPDSVWAAKVSFHNPDDDAVYACNVRYSMVEDYTAT